MHATSCRNLLHMPLVILRIILEDLYHSDRTDFYNFGLVSRACRFESEYLLFRDIAIHDETRLGKKESLKAVKRIINAKESVGEYVRHITLGHFSDEDWFYFELSPLLEDVLRSIKGLQSLTWKTHHAVRPTFTSLLNEIHSSARLHLNLEHRNCTPLSRSLLSSPQLYSLKVSIYYAYINNSRTYSELPFIRKCLSSSLKGLQLSFIQVGNPDPRPKFIEWETVEEGPFNFDWNESDRFGALEELTFREGFYDLNAEHCRIWASVMSWESLQRLDTDQGAPQHLFASLTNRAVNLKFLKFRVHGRPSSVWGLSPLDGGVSKLTRFIESVIALQELDFGTDTFQDCQNVFPPLLRSTKGSLRRLTVECNHFDQQSWPPERFMDIFEQAPELEYLKASIQGDKVEGSWEGRKIKLRPQRKFDLATKKIAKLNGSPRGPGAHSIMRLRC